MTAAIGDRPVGGGPQHDDHQPIRDLVRRYLERDGFAVLTAGSGAAALDLIRTLQACLSAG